MIALTDEGGQMIDGWVRMSALCLDCGARLGEIQAEATAALLAQLLLSQSAAAADELRYRVGEANRVLVDAESQMRLLLEEQWREEAAAPEAA